MSWPSQQLNLLGSVSSLSTNYNSSKIAVTTSNGSTPGYIKVGVYDEINTYYSYTQQSIIIQNVNESLKTWGKVSMDHDGNIIATNINNDSIFLGILDSSGNYVWTKTTTTNTFKDFTFLYNNNRINIFTTDGTSLYFIQLSIVNNYINTETITTIKTNGTLFKSLKMYYNSTDNLYDLLTIDENKIYFTKDLDILLINNIQWTTITNPINFTSKWLDIVYFKNTFDNNTFYIMAISYSTEGGYLYACKYLNGNFGNLVKQNNLDLTDKQKYFSSITVNISGNKVAVSTFDGFVFIGYYNNNNQNNQYYTWSKLTPFGSVSSSNSQWISLLDNSIFFNSGNVGIGTSNPNSRLHVNGDIIGNLLGNATGISGGNQGNLLYQSNTGTTGFVGIGTTGFVLTSGGGGAPSWSNVDSNNIPLTFVKRDSSGNFSANLITSNLLGNSTGISGGNPGDLIYIDSSGITNFIPNGSSTQVIGSNGLIPSWVDTTSDNNFNTIVRRDPSGNFSANLITANLNGNADTATSIKEGDTGNLIYQSAPGVTSFVSAGLLNQVLFNDGAKPKWINSTENNEADTIIKRDSSGNFSANLITANLNGNSTGISGGISGDLIYIDSSGITNFIHHGSENQILGLNNYLPSWIDSTDQNINNTIVRRDSSGNFNGHIITAYLFDGNAWSASRIAGGNSGNLLYQSNTGTTGFVGIGTTGWVLTSDSSNVPIWTNTTSSNTVSSIVKRDSSGNFSANIITAFGNVGIGVSVPTSNLHVNGSGNITGNLLIGGTITGSLSGNASSATNVAGGLTGNILYQTGTGLTGFIPNGTSGQVLTTGVGTAIPKWTDVATANTALAIVQRDASGNFSAGTITATTFSGALSGNATTATNLAGGGAGQIHYQTGVGTSAFLTIGTSGQILSSNGSIPAWITPTSANTVSAIVQRDASGNFSAGTITATTFSGALSGNATTATNLAGGSAGQLHYQTGVGTSAFLTVGTSGQILSSNGSIPAWITPTSANTISTIVQRDASGNFSAGTITATTFSGALSGNASSATHLAGGGAGQIHYQTSVGTSAFLAIGTSGQILSSNGSIPAWITPTSANTVSAIVQRDASGNFSAGTITGSLSGNATSATNLAGGSAGQIHYQTGVGTSAFLTLGTSGQILSSNVVFQHG